MKHTIIVLITLLVPSSAFASPPDLCEQDVLLDETGQPMTDSQGVTLSRYCEWAGPDVPVWADTMCCSLGAAGATCSVTSERGRCATGLDAYYCEYGEQTVGGFVCYESFPSACETGSCSGVQSPEAGPLEGVICCSYGACVSWEDEDAGDCGGFYTWCNIGYSKEDGTIDCYG